MSEKMQKWVMLPSTWIEAHQLRTLRWEGDGRGSGDAAALMALTVIAHHADQETGVAKLTYEQMCQATGLSRAKLAAGLDVLADKLEVVERTPAGRSTFHLTHYDPNGGWAKLPACGMYSGNIIAGFADFHLRRPTELNALKLFFLFASRRDRTSNMAIISYDKIELYTGIDRARIKPAISLLASASLVYVEQLPSQNFEHGIANAYRLVGLDPYTHMGTAGRQDQAIFGAASIQ
jgi:hypothetical protein